MADSELEAFKTEIDLRAYAANHGYQLDRKESWRGASVMRHANGDKIVVKRDVDAHYVYFSVRDDRDNGTIIDFAKRRLGMSLGAVRKELRPWLGTPSTVIDTYPALPKVARDRIRVERAYSWTTEATRHAYLEDERGIPSDLLAGRRFAGRVRIDRRGNAVFPHFDAEALSGFELKNRGFTGFSTGGTKGLWTSCAFPEDNRLVVCESAIDALSHAALFPDDRTRYASIGGQVTTAQRTLLRAAISLMPASSTVVAAMDNDEAGRVLAEVVANALRLAARADIRFAIDEPAGAKDWNDILRARRLAPLPFSASVPYVA